MLFIFSPLITFIIFQQKYFIVRELIWFWNNICFFLVVYCFYSLSTILSMDLYWVTFESITICDTALFKEGNHNFIMQFCCLQLKFIYRLYTCTKPQGLFLLKFMASGALLITSLQTVWRFIGQPLWTIAICPSIGRYIWSSWVGRTYHRVMLGNWSGKQMTICTINW